MKAQMYIEVDSAKFTDAELESLSSIDAEYVILGSESGRGYLHFILKDESKIEDLKTILSKRTPVVTGAWSKDAVPLGKSCTICEKGEKSITGTAQYKLNLSTHLKYSKIVDAEGKVSFESTFKPLHQFAGWELCSEYNETETEIKKEIKWQS